MATSLDLQEQEQLDAVKAFWNKYGNLITWALTIVLAGFAAWNGWNWWQREQAVKAAAMFDELADTWIHPRDGQKAPTSGKGSSLFPWTLFKAALSSHRALSETVANRRRTLEGRDGSVKDSTNIAEYETLGRLGELAAEVPDGSASKLEALVSQLQDIGVGPRSVVLGGTF